MISGKKEQSQKIVARLIIAFLDIFIKRKNVLDKNNEFIKEKILKLKEKEKNKITKRYKDMTRDESEVEKILQINKLGDWNLGLTKALHVYSTDQFDKERAEMMKDFDDELKIGKKGQIEQILGEADFSEADIHEMDMTARRKAAMAIEFSLIGDDDDFGDLDGDERF